MIDPAMPPLDNKETLVQKMVREQAERDGMVLCEKCSNANWKVYHKSGDCNTDKQTRT